MDTVVRADRDHAALGRTWARIAVADHLHRSDPNVTWLRREPPRASPRRACRSSRTPRAGLRRSSTTAHGPSPSTPIASRASTLPCPTAAAISTPTTARGEVAQRDGSGLQHEGVDELGLGLGERADRGAPQGSQVRSASEGVAEVGSERAHVGARRALDLDAVDERIGRRLDVESVDGHRPRRTLDLDALPGELVQAAPVDLEGRHHRRHLHDRAGQRRCRGDDLREVDVHRVHHCGVP